MSLIKEAKTKEDKQGKTRLLLNVHLEQGSKDLYYRATQVWALFWQNPDGLSCQDVFDSFAEDGLTMALMLTQAKSIIDKIEPGLWQLERLGTVVPVLVDDIPNGHVVVTLNKENV